MLGLRRHQLVGLIVVAFGLVPAATASAAGPVFTGHSGWFWGSPTPQGENLTAVSFAGESGYAVGAIGTALRSTDGGQSWSGLATGSLDHLTAVQQLGSDTAIVSGGCTVAESRRTGPPARPCAGRATG